MFLCYIELHHTCDVLCLEGLLKDLAQVLQMQKAICCSADWPALNVTLLKGLIVQALLHKEQSLAILNQFFSSMWNSFMSDLTLSLQRSFGPCAGRLFGNQPKRNSLGFVCLSFLSSVQAIVVFKMK